MPAADTVIRRVGGAVRPGSVDLSPLDECLEIDRMKAAAEVRKDHGHPCDASLCEDIRPARFSRLLLSGLIAASFLIISGGKVHGSRPDKDQPASSSHAIADVVLVTRGDPEPFRGADGARHCPAGATTATGDLLASTIPGNPAMQPTERVMVIDENGLPRLWPSPGLAAGRGRGAMSPAQ